MTERIDTRVAFQWIIYSSVFRFKTQALWLFLKSVRAHLRGVQCEIQTECNVKTSHHCMICKLRFLGWIKQTSFFCRGGIKKSILWCIAILSSTILNRFSIFQNRFWACFFSCIWHVCTRDAAGFIAQNLRCETRAHCLTVCASTRRVYFRYAFIYTVWNAVLLDAQNSRTDRLWRALCVCLSWSSIAAAVKCCCIFEYFYTKLMYTQSVMFSEQDKASDISK